MILVILLYRFILLRVNILENPFRDVVSMCKHNIMQLFINLIATVRFYPVQNLLLKQGATERLKQNNVRT